MKKSKENEGEIQAQDLIDYTNELMDAKINGTNGYLRRNLFKTDAMFIMSPDLTSDIEDMKTKLHKEHIIPDVFGMPFKRDILKCQGKSIYKTSAGYFKKNWLVLTNGELFIYIDKKATKH